MPFCGGWGNYAHFHLLQSKMMFGSMMYSFYEFFLLFRIKCSFTDLAVLASYTLQAANGDYHAGQGGHEAIEFSYSTQKSQEFLRRVDELHQSHR